jgi:hypothetical protein
MQFKRHQKHVLVPPNMQVICTSGVFRFSLQLTHRLSSFFTYVVEVVFSSQMFAFGTLLRGTM